MEDKGLERFGRISYKKKRVNYVVCGEIASAKLKFKLEDGEG